MAGVMQNYRAIAGLTAAILGLVTIAFARLLRQPGSGCLDRPLTRRDRRGAREVLAIPHSCWSASSREFSVIDSEFAAGA
jgi:hypothetical protein